MLSDTSSVCQEANSSQFGNTGLDIVSTLQQREGKPKKSVRESKPRENKGMLQNLPRCLLALIRKLGLDTNSLSMMKGIFENAVSNIILNGEKTIHFIQNKTNEVVENILHALRFK